MYQITVFLLTILRRNAPTCDTFKIASRNLVLQSCNSRWSYIGPLLLIFSKCIKLLFFLVAVSRGTAPTRDTFKITSWNLVLFLSNTQGSYVRLLLLIRFFLVTTLHWNAPTSRVLLASFRVLLRLSSNAIVVAPTTSQLTDEFQPPSKSWLVSGKLVPCLAAIISGPRLHF